MVGVNIRPDDTSARVRASTPATTAAQPPLEQLARDVVQKGASFEVPRRFRLWGPKLREADADEVAKRLQQGKRDAEVHLPTGNLPLRSPEDLTELAVFLGGAPPESLSHARLAHDLQELAGQGWRFHAGETEVGLYGAYNALTDASFELEALTARRDGASVPLADGGGVGEMQRFYNADPLGKLELQGYQFFDAEGHRRAALGAPPASLGREGQPWLEVGRIQELPRLEAHLQTYGSSDLARRAFAYEDDHDLARLWNGLQPEERERLTPLALSAQPDLLQTAPLIRPEDRGVQKAWLEAMARQPATEKMARLALEVARDPKLAEAAWQTLVRCPDPKTGAELLQAQPPGSAAYLKALEDYPDTQDKVRQLQAWQPSDVGYALRGLPRALAGENLALVCTHPDDWAMQQRQLPAVNLDVCSEMPTRSMRTLFWQASLQSKTPTTFAELVEVARAFDRLSAGKLKPEDVQAVRAGMLRQAARMPDTKPTLDLVKSWGITPDDNILNALYNGHSAAKPKELALACTPVDAAQDAQLRQLVPDNDVARSLRSLCGSEKARTAMWRAGLEHPRLRSSSEMMAMLRDFDQRLGTGAYPGREEDIAALRKGIYPLLGQLPDAQKAYQRQQAWQLADPDKAYGALQENLAAGTPEQVGALALASTADSDLPAQERQLAELGPDHPAHRMRAACQAPQTKLAFWKAAMEKPLVSSGAEVIQFAKVFDQKNGTQDFPNRESDIQAVRRILLAEMDRYADTRPARDLQRSWQLVNEDTALSGMLGNPKLGTPEGVGAFALASTDPTDLAAQDRQLAANPLVKELRDAASTPETRLALWKAGMEHPCIGTAAELYAMLTRFDALNQSQYAGRDADIAKIQPLIYRQMGRLPDSKAAYEAQQKWHLADFGQALNGLYQRLPAGTPEELGKLALASTREDDLAAQKLQLQQLADPSTAAVLSRMADVATSPKTRVALWKTGLAHPGAVTSSDELLTLLRKFDEALPTTVTFPGRNEDIAAIRRQIFAELKKLPDSAAAAAQVEAWQPANWDTGYDGLLKNRKASTPEEVRALALDCTLWSDAAMQDRQLAQLAPRDMAELATLVRGRVASPEVRWAVWHVVIENPFMTTSKEVQKATARMHELLANRPELQGEIETAGGIMEAAMQLWAMRAKQTQTIAEEEGRVIVGGVVLRRPARSAPGQEQASSGGLG